MQGTSGRYLGLYVLQNSAAGHSETGCVTACGECTSMMRDVLVWRSEAAVTCFFFFMDFAWGVLFLWGFRV